DQVVELTRHRQRPEPGALAGRLGHVGGRVRRRPPHRDFDAPGVAVEPGGNAGVTDRVVVAGLADRGQRYSGGALGTAGTPGQLGGPFRDGLVPAGPWHGLVHQAPLDGLLAPDALRPSGEVVGQIPPYVPLV